MMEQPKQCKGWYKKQSDGKLLAIKMTLKEENRAYYEGNGFAYGEFEQRFCGSYFPTGKCPEKTDAEVVEIRNGLYKKKNALLNAVMSGAESSKQYVKEIAQIKFENKKSDQTDMTLVEMFNKVATEWNFAHGREHNLFVEIATSEEDLK